MLGVDCPKLLSAAASCQIDGRLQFNLSYSQMVWPGILEAERPFLYVNAMPNKTSKKSSKVAEPRKAATESSDHFSASRKIEEMIASLGDWRGEWLAEIRRLIH